MKVTHKDSFSFFFLGGGGGGEGASTYPPPPPPGNFNFGPFIRRTLVESGTVFAQT